MSATREELRIATASGSISCRNRIDELDQTQASAPGSPAAAAHKLEQMYAGQKDTDSWKPGEKDIASAASISARNSSLLPGESAPSLFSGASFQLDQVHLAKSLRKASIWNAAGTRRF